MLQKIIESKYGSDVVKAIGLLRNNRRARELGWVVTGAVLRGGCITVSLPDGPEIMYSFGGRGFGHDVLSHLLTNDVNVMITVPDGGGVGSTSEARQTLRYNSTLRWS